jgi:GNAT superfamily N-acetyltransferase
MEIKQVKKNDVKGFQRREWKKFDRELGFEWKDEEVVLAAFQGSEVIGTANIKFLGNVAYLERLMVAKTQRGKGIGSALMEKYEKLACKKGCHKLRVKTAEWMGQNVSFYKKHGFKVEAKLKKDYHNKDWVILSKFI